VFVPGKPFPPSLFFVGKARANPSEAPLGAVPYGRLLALPTDISLGWKGLQGASFFEHMSFIIVKT
jgi:hypothetical protein